MKLIVKIKDAELRTKVLAFYPEAEEAIAEDLQFWLTYGDKRLQTAVTISGGNVPVQYKDENGEIRSYFSHRFSLTLGVDDLDIVDDSGRVWTAEDAFYEPITECHYDDGVKVL